MIQETSGYQGYFKIITKYGIETESMKILVDKLKVLPVDIKPIFEIENG